MALQELLPERLGALIPRHSDEDAPLCLIRKDAAQEQEHQLAKDQDAVDPNVSQHLEQLLLADSDDRLEYVQHANPGLTEDHLDQIASTSQRWLDAEARDRIRVLARKCYDDGQDARTALINWYTIEEFHRLAEIFRATTIPDLDLAMCYAVCEARDAVYASHFIYLARSRHGVDLGVTNQTPEKIASDISFVNAR